MAAPFSSAITYLGKDRLERFRTPDSVSHRCDLPARVVPGLRRNNVRLERTIRLCGFLLPLRVRRFRPRLGSVVESQEDVASDAVTTPVPPDEAARVRALARILDSAIRVPGTGITLGLDSLVGLVPGVGDLAGAVMSGYIVIAAARMGVPPAVVTKMVLNLGVDTLVGSVPLLGDLFDVGFRANMRNAALLDRHLAEPVAVRRSSRLAVLAAIGGVVVLAAAGVFLAILTVRGLNWLVR